MRRKLQDILDPELIVDLEATTVEGAIHELAERLAVAGRIPDGDVASVAHGIVRREVLGTTGLGQGFAMPNLRRPDVTGLMVVAGRSRTPIDWQSLDGEPVRIVFCVVGPLDQPGTRLRASEVLVRFIASRSMDRLLAGEAFKETLLAAAKEYDER